MRNRRIREHIEFREGHEMHENYYIKKVKIVKSSKMCENPPISKQNPNPDLRDSAPIRCAFHVGDRKLKETDTGEAHASEGVLKTQCHDHQ